MADVLVHSRFPKVLLEPIMKRFDSLYVDAPHLRDTTSNEQLAKIRAIVLFGGSDRMTAEMFDIMPRLGAVICYGSGYDNVDLDEAEKRGIVVGHSPGGNAAAVAEQAVTLLLAAVRQTVPADSYIRSGDWAARKPSPFIMPVKAVTCRRIGIYGVGEIGKKVITYLGGFGAELAYSSRSRHDDVSIPYKQTLEELADWADTLIVAVRAMPNNRHVINADILRRLGRDGVVVNVARGTVVDQIALGTALKTGVIAAAALDVLEPEPSHPAEFINLPNIVLSPHMGGNTFESRLNQQTKTIANLDAYFAGQPLPHPVRNLGVERPRQS